MPAPWLSWVVLSVLAIPMAQGAMTITATPPDHPIVPDTGQAELPIVVAVDCADLATRTPEPMQTAEVGLAVAADAPGLVFAGPLEVEVPLEGCVQPGALQAAGSTTLKVGFTREAPGETNVTVTVSGTLAKGAGQAAVQAATSTVLRAAFSGLVVVGVETAILTTQEGMAIAHVTVRNEGNAPATIRFTLAEVGPHMDPLLPGPLLLPPAMQDAARANATFAIPFKTHGSWGQEVVRLGVASFSTQDPSQQSAPTAVHFLIRNGDRFLGVPATGPPLALALLCVALIARRRA